MAMIDLVCSKCGATIELDDSREFGFCSFCGNKVMLQQDNNERKEIENLRKLLDAASESDNLNEALRISNRILEYDSTDPKAWYCKGRAALSKCDIGGGVAHLKNYVEYSKPEDIVKNLHQMAKDIGYAYFFEEKCPYINFEIPESIIDLTYDTETKICELVPKEYYFDIDIIENIIQCVINSQDADKIGDGCAKVKYMFSTSFFDSNPHIDFVYRGSVAINKMVIRAKDAFLDKSFPDYPPDYISKLSNSLSMEIELYEQLMSKSKPINDNMSDDDIEAMFNNWMENDSSILFNKFMDIHDMSMELHRIPSLFDIKKRKNRDKAIDDLLATLIEPVSK